MAKLVCLECGQVNRVPAERFSAGPKCGICGAKLMDGAGAGAGAGCAGEGGADGRAAAGGGLLGALVRALPDDGAGTGEGGAGAGAAGALRQDRHGGASRNSGRATGSAGYRCWWRSRAGGSGPGRPGRSRRRGSRTGCGGRWSRRREDGGNATGGGDIENSVETLLKQLCGRSMVSSEPREDADEADWMSKMVRSKDKEVPQPQKPSPPPAPAGGWRFSDWASLDGARRGRPDVGVRSRAVRFMGSRRRVSPAERSARC